jgi:hypothetical protein
VLQSERGLTVEQSAVASGVTQGQMLRIERGTIGMAMTVVGRLAEALIIEPRDPFVDRRYRQLTSEVSCQG